MSAQSRVALAHGQEFRIRRAQARRTIYALNYIEGRRALADLIEEMPEWLKGELVGRVLLWPRRMGLAAVGRMLTKLAGNGCRIPEMRRLGDLTERQRETLQAVLRGEALTDAEEVAATRICRSCLEEKPCSDFPFNGGDRRRAECYSCDAVRRLRRYVCEERPGADPKALPLEPFAQWLTRKLDRHKREHGGSERTFAASLGIGERRLARYIHREQPTVTLTIVDRVLIHEGSTNLIELYPELYPDLSPAELEAAI